MVRGIQKHGQGVQGNDFWPPTSAPALLKKFIKFRFLVGFEGGSASKFGPVSRREIQNRHGRVLGRKNRREWAEAPSDVRKTRFWAAPNRFGRDGAGFWRGAEIPKVAFSNPKNVGKMKKSIFRPKSKVVARCELWVRGVEKYA